MSRTGDEDDATLRFNDKSKSNITEESSKTRASTYVKLEDLMKRLEKFTTKNNKLRKKEKSRSKRVCYNYGKNGHFIAQCPYEKKEEENNKRKNFDKGYKKDKKYTKKNPYGQGHVGQK
jgi:hypothetical protein